MSTGIASFLFIALLAVSLAHLLWSLGNTWPIRDERLLAQTVIGKPGIERMPSRWRQFGIALVTFASGVIVLALADHDSGGLGLTLAGLPFAALYLVRGILGYVPGWAERRPEPSFQTNNRRVYAPLCLLIGIGFVVLIGLRLI